MLWLWQLQQMHAAGCLGSRHLCAAKGDSGKGMPKRMSRHFATNVTKVCDQKRHITTLSVKGRQTGMFQTGGFPDLDLSFLFVPFLSFLGLSRFFRDFPDLLGDGSGIFAIRPFPLSRPIKSTYEEQSRKGPRHDLDLSRKKVGNTRVWKHPGLASLNIWLSLSLSSSAMETSD